MNEDAPISIPVPPQIAAAWQALPPERRASFARAIVAAWLEPLLLQGDRIILKILPPLQRRLGSAAPQQTSLERSLSHG
jgi:hypothetical protein